MSVAFCPVLARCFAAVLYGGSGSPQAEAFAARLPRLKVHGRVTVVLARLPPPKPEKACAAFCILHARFSGVATPKYMAGKGR